MTHDEDGLARLAASLLGLERGAALAERPGGTDHRAQFARDDSEDVACGRFCFGRPSGTWAVPNSRG